MHSFRVQLFSEKEVAPQVFSLERLLMTGFSVCFEVALGR